MLKIETWKENQILRTISEDVKISELNTYINLWREMIKYIKNPDNHWVGLAAPQVWYNKRLIVVSLLKDWDDENYQTVMMLNPKIIDNSNETDFETEWCLSVPWAKGDVERFLKLKISYIDENKKERIIILSWVSARIVQHEIDHLDWILFTDKIKK